MSWEKSLQRAIDLAVCHALHPWTDDQCYLNARIAANYAFMLRPDLREPRTWIHPEALQFRGRKGQTWSPGDDLPHS